MKKDLMEEIDDALGDHYDDQLKQIIDTHFGYESPERSTMFNKNKLPFLHAPSCYPKNEANAMQCQRYTGKIGLEYLRQDNSEYYWTLRADGYAGSTRNRTRNYLAGLGTGPYWAGDMDTKSHRLGLELGNLIKWEK